MNSLEHTSSTNEISEIDVPSLGWRTAENQERLYRQRLAVIGAGGAGGGVAESAAREGISLTIADPDNFDTTNLNRQTGAYADTLGQNKAFAIAALAKKIRSEPYDLRVFEKGLTHENIDEVLADATLVLDAIDISRPDLSVELAREARKRGLPLFFGIEIGLGCMLTCFAPGAEERDTLEHYFGLGIDENIGLDTSVPASKLITHMPSYTPRGLLEAFQSGQLPSTPGIHPGVLTHTGAMMTVIERWIFEDKTSYPQFVYPYMYAIDPIDGLMVVHADDREEHLSASLKLIGKNRISSGFSLPEDYTVAKL